MAIKIEASNIKIIRNLCIISYVNICYINGFKLVRISQQILV